MSSHVKLSLALALAVGAGALRVLLNAGPETEGVSALFTGVDAQRLLAKWGISRASVSVQSTGVMYRVEGRAQGIDGEVLVGVFALLSEAEEAFRTLAGTPMAPSEVQNGAPGDQFLYWPPHREGATCRVLLRRRNAVLSAHWRGTVEGAVEFARELDRMLLTDSELAPSAPAVPVPSVDIVVPERVVALREVKIRFTATRGARVRLCRSVGIRVEGGQATRTVLGWDPSRLVTEGAPSVAFSAPGTHELKLHFATEHNVLFTESVTVSVIGPRELTSPGISQWLAFPGELYFLQDTGQKWTAGPAAEREWLQLPRGTFQDIRDPADAQQSAVAEVRQYVQPRWLPDDVAPLLQVARNWSRPGGRVCFCTSYKLPNGYNVALMGELGRQFWLYIEEPDPVPPGRTPLGSADVLRSDLVELEEAETGETAYPRAAFMCRTFRRYRAYKHDGPYEPVRIIFVNVQLPGQVNLRFPGYP